MTELLELQQLLSDRAKRLVGDGPVLSAAEASGIPEANLRRVIKMHGNPSLETTYLILKASGVDLVAILAQK